MKVTIDGDGLSLEMNRNDNGTWACICRDEGGNTEERTLSDKEAAATAALTVGMEGGDLNGAPTLEQALYNAVGTAWDGATARPIP